MSDTRLAEMRRDVEARVREQIERHLRINPHGDIGRIVEIQLRQEEERLERLIDEAQDDPAQAEVLVALLSWLPQLGQQLRYSGRRRLR